MKKILPLILVLVITLSLFSGCAKDMENKPQAQSVTTSAPLETTVTKVDNPNAEMFTDRDFRTDYDENNSVAISLNGSSAAASSESVKVSGSTVTITEEATYVISGELNDGMVIVDAPDTAKLQIVFKDVDITSKTSAALYIINADKVFLTLAEGSTNNIANGGKFTAIDDNNIDSALFSKQDLTLNGTGALTVTSPAGHGIACKDDLVVTGGSYVVNSASHGMDVNDSVRIINATLTIDSGKDAIHCENSDDSSKGFVYIGSGSIKAEAEGDGISAGSYMHITDGAIDLLTGGGSENGTKEYSDSFGGFMGGKRPEDMQSIEADEDSTSMKGLKATGNLEISGGNIIVNSADDAIHSDASLTVNSGIITIESGDDAIHADESLTVINGVIDISKSYEGLEALNIDVQGGDIKLVAADDGLNAAGGNDESGTTGGRDGMFGRGPGGHGGMGGMSGNSNGSIKVSGGTLYINSSGDGLDANGTLEISGGHTTVVGPIYGDTATLDYDISAVITGGTFIGTGASGGMAQSFSDSEQGVVAVSVGSQSAGTEIVLKDSRGDIIISHKPELDFAVAIISAPELVKGETYSLTVGSESGDFEAR